MGAAGTGFRFRISRKFTGDPAVSGIRVFAVISANVVSELRYPAEYPWGGPAGSPSLYTPELKDAILGPAPRPAR